LRLAPAARITAPTDEATQAAVIRDEMGTGIFLLQSGAKIGKISPSPFQTVVDIHMLWFFERNQEVAQLETLFDNDTAEFVALIRWPDGHEDVGRSPDVESYRALL